MSELGTVETQIPRDGWGRPKVVPPGGGRPVAYTRVTTFVSALEDTYNLEKWKMRMVALGLVDRQDLHLAVAAHRDDKQHLNKICDEALDAAKASAAATTGTALHALVDQYDRGTLDLEKVPAAYRPDIEAYAQATAALEVVDIEQFGVHDGLRVGGTWDRIYRYQGQAYIGDTKTGSIEYGAGKIAMQLGTYSRCARYTADGNRHPLDVDQGKALVVHLPAGTGTCTLHWVDIAAGWAAVDLARQVREWRKRKDLFGEFHPEVPDLAEAIATAASVEALTALWAAHQGAWTDEHTSLAAARKALLEGRAVA